MMQRILDQSGFLGVALIACLSMYVPALHALSWEEFHIARSFFYAGTLGLLLCAVIVVSISHYQRVSSSLEHLAALFAVFVVLPLALAIPFYEAVKTTTFLNAYVEMVSSLTTTGASLFEPSRLHPSLHLWRGLVGWSGGFLMWVAAAAILAPLNLGGFEVTTSAMPGQSGLRRQDMRAASPAERMMRVSKTLFPIYSALTATLWLCLVIAGEVPMTAFLASLATLSTSGIQGVQSLTAPVQGFPTMEMIVFLFFFFGISRLTFSTDTITGPKRGLLQDAEFRIGLGLIIGVPLLLVLRHWAGAFDVNAEGDFLDGVRALWGSVFTVTSFLTTTGFVSAEWEAARGWSGLATPGIILMGLALMGGGVATTAGGVKLLRVFTLYLNGLREMQRLIHPSSVGGKGANDRRIRRQGAYTAWVFFMLFGLSLAGVVLALTAFGATFEEALVLAVSALTTTGPILNVASNEPIVLSTLPEGTKLVFAFASVLGRMEALAIIALLTPALWRR